MAAVFLISNGSNIHDAPKVCDTAVDVLDDDNVVNGYDSAGYDESAPKTVEQILAEAAAGETDNPFGDDPESDNPFGDESDSDSANPFGNDSDAESENNPFGETKSRSNTGSSRNSKPTYKPTTSMPQVPLHQVAEYGFLLVLNALLDRNVDLNFANENGDTGLVHSRDFNFII